MSDNPASPTPPETPSPTTSGTMFTPPSSRERSLPSAVWAIAGLVVLAVLAALLINGRRQAELPATTARALDPYATSLPVTGLVMSESTSLSGGKSTFIDGHIRNAGARTVTAATVQVFFRNEEGMPPTIETLPVSLIRTREPYVDTQPISSSPIKPGEDREFRLIFEAIPGNWNVQLPDIHVVHVATE